MSNAYDSHLATLLDRIGAVGREVASGLMDRAREKAPDLDAAAFLDDAERTARQFASTFWDATMTRTGKSPNDPEWATPIAAEIFRRYAERVAADIRTHADMVFADLAAADRSVRRPDGPVH